jgi:hypothetical protein
VPTALQLGHLHAHRKSDIASWQEKEGYLKRQVEEAHASDLDEGQSEYHRIRLSSCRLPTLAGRVDGESVGIKERREFASGVQQMLRLRNKYVYAPHVPDFQNTKLLEYQEAVCAQPLEFHPPPVEGFARSANGDVPEIAWRDGVVCLVASGSEVDSGRPPEYSEFAHDLTSVWAFAKNKVMSTLCVSPWL